MRCSRPDIGIVGNRQILERNRQLTGIIEFKPVPLRGMARPPFVDPDMGDIAQLSHSSVLASRSRNRHQTDVPARIQPNGHPGDLRSVNPFIKNKAIGINQTDMSTLAPEFKRRDKIHPLKWVVTWVLIPPQRQCQKSTG